MQKNIYPRPCLDCTNRIENLSDDKRRLADSGGAVIVFCHDKVYFASNKQSTQTTYEELPQENPTLDSAIKDCAASNPLVTQTSSQLEKLRLQILGPRDIRQSCGALARLAAEASDASNQIEAGPALDVFIK